MLMLTTFHTNVSGEKTDEVRIQQVKGQLHFDIIILLWPLLKRHNSGTEGEVMTAFNIWSDTDLVALRFRN